MAVITRDNESLARLVKAAGEGRHSTLQDCRLSVLADILTRRVNPDVLVSPVASRTMVFPHQVATCHAVLNLMEGRAILADEVGLGKTIEAGMVLTEYRVRGEAERVLVVTPAGLTTQWQEELLGRFNIAFPIVDGKGVEDGRVEALGEAPGAITSIAFAKREGVREQFQEREWDLVIVDEAHNLKNPATLNYKFVGGLKAQRLLLLTATPLQNSLGELLTLVNLVRPASLTGRSLGKRLGRDLDPREAEALRKRLSATMIRNRRAEVAGEVTLPPRTARTVRVRLDDPGKALYQAVSDYAVDGYRRSATAHNAAYGFYLMGIQRMLSSSVESLSASLRRRVESLNGLLGLRKRDRRRLREMLPDAEEGEPLPAVMKKRLQDEIGVLEGLVKLAGKVARQPKRKALLRILKELFRREPDARVIIFTEFLETQAMLVETLLGEGWATEAYRGGLTITEKNAVIERFEKGRILVSTEAGSEGRNLQFSHVVVNYDLPWNPMRVEQRIGRVHRLGQTKPVLVVNLVASGTVEDHLLRVLDRKLGMFRETLGDLETILGILSPEGSPETVVMEAFVKGHARKGGGLKGFAKAMEASVEDSGKTLSHAFADSKIDLRPPHVDAPAVIPLYDDNELLERAFREFLDKFNVLQDAEGGIYRFRMPYFLSLGEGGLFPEEVRGTFSKSAALDKPWLHHISVTHPFLVQAMEEARGLPVCSADMGRDRLAEMGLPAGEDTLLYLPVRISWQVGDREYEEVVAVAADGQEEVVRAEVDEEALWAEDVPAAFLPEFDLDGLATTALEAVRDYAGEEATILTKEARGRRNERLRGLEERAEAALAGIHQQADLAHRDLSRLEKGADPDREKVAALKRKRAGLLGEGGRLKRQQETLAAMRASSAEGLVKATLTPLAAIRIRVL